jgi:Mn-dependent DtxR family transcriptional regulator
LEKHPTKYYTAKQLAIALNLSKESVTKNLQKLRRWNLVDYKDFPSTKDTLCYGHKKPA